MQNLSRRLFSTTRLLVRTARRASLPLRRFVALGLLGGTVLLALPGSLLAQRPETEDKEWVGTWAVGPAQAAANQYNDQTLRLIVHTTTAGSVVRVRLSNEHGAEALTIGGAHIARRDSGANIVPGTSRRLTFSQGNGITIPPGAAALSDPVNLDVPALGDLAVSIYLPGTTAVTTIHPDGKKTSYVSPANGGDAGDATVFPLDATAPTTTEVPILTRVEVFAPTATGGGIVIFGASISEGFNTTRDANRAWVNVIAQRLQAQSRSLGVVSVGIAGNRVRYDDPTAGGLGFGQSGLGRFDRDALTAPGVRYVIVLEGHNDLSFQFSLAPTQPETADDIIAGYQQFIVRAHALGVKVMGCTLSPNGGSTNTEPIRTAVNNWVRTSGAFDAVLDCDALLRDPSQPTRLLPAYDSGDGLHPNDAGQAVMGNGVDLSFFQ